MTDHLQVSTQPSANRSVSVLAATMITLVVAALSTILPSPAVGATSLRVDSLAWDVIGLDSNKPADGPDTFPVGARVCNDGTSAAENVAASFVWDTENSFVSLAGPASLQTVSIPANSCYDFYFNVSVQKLKDAFDTSRAYHIDITSDGGTSLSTPTSRQLFVEHLVSQNRNQITAITGPGGVAAETTVFVGQTYTYELHGSTATNGYEQLEAFVDFPNLIFQIL